MNNKLNIKLLIKYIVKLVVTIPKLLIVNIYKLIAGNYNEFSKRIRFSIALKITTAFVLRMIGFLVFLNLLILAGFGFYLGYNAKVDMEKDISLISSYKNANVESIYEPIEKISKIKDRQVSIFDSENKFSFSSEKDKDKVIYYGKAPSIEADVDKYILISNDEVSPHFKNSSINNTTKFFIVLDEKIDINGKEYSIQIVDKLEDEFIYIGILLSALAVITIIAILTTIVTGRKTSKKVLKPVHKMSNTVKNININVLDRRIDVSGSQDELKDLAHTFNSMLDRIEHSYEQQNQFVSDASHELRTPIAVIQGYANLLDRWGKNDKEVLEESISAIKSETESMKCLVEQLLFLARGDKNTQKIEKIDFYMDELIDEIVRETMLIDENHEIISVRNERFQIDADRNLLKEALRIFVDNSTKYTASGGYIRLNSYEHEEYAIISVEDNGLGISKEDLPHIFDRFYRADKSRTKESGGTGLGLSIAKWIIMKHKGAIEVESKVGEGTKINIRLPHK